MANLGQGQNIPFSGIYLHILLNYFRFRHHLKYCILELICFYTPLTEMKCNMIIFSGLPKVQFMDEDLFTNMAVELDYPQQKLLMEE